jgi:tetratricopeptide (TPR) repeat protein
VLNSRKALATLAWSLLSLAPAFGADTALGTDPQASGGSQFEALVREGDAAEAQFNPDRALPFYLKAHSERPGDPQILLKIAKQYSDSTLAISDPNENRRRIEKALEYSQRAAELDPHSPVALLSKAVCYGKLGLYSDTREKIEYSRLVKVYAEQALAADPKYAYAHDVLGQWEYNVASLGLTKRFLIALIYGGIPQASTAEGVRHLEMAVQLEPNTASHRLGLGFAYLANGEPMKARRLFEQVMAMPCRELYDTDCHSQAERALASL